MSAFVASCYGLSVLVLLVAVAIVAAADLTPEEVQAWMATNEDFDWQQPEAAAVVRIDSRGTQDADGNLYFAGSKTLDSSDVDQLDIFVAQVKADDSLGWTRQYLYMAGCTWGYPHEGGHALNSFGQYGGHDVVLAKISLSGDKLWMRQVVALAASSRWVMMVSVCSCVFVLCVVFLMCVLLSVRDDGQRLRVRRGAGRQLHTLLLSGGCVTHQVDEIVEVDVAQMLETRTHAGTMSDYEAQIMDPNARASVENQQYGFSVNLNFGGDILDYAMDDGVALRPRRRRIREGGLVAEYADCGFWDKNFVALAPTVYDQSAWGSHSIPAPNVNVASAGNSQVAVTPAILAFTSTNWSPPQRVVVRAAGDAIAKPHTRT
ncbi:hypothetical protein PHYSODRAFT_250808 [Phytophthora sojae]|uniref:Uncharacterized protein n=1 Tax=Phytophthora sojae (strain P6497) TaxID=1094619 RepID=G4ZXK2_PHYSP|nr:hypothetical protein PHYSODRAFT_250808 [Phytophthora sojae]EGZ11865.1 hypothetical protein PHYSODRAFT_250808 [Phytophthora sojae]|eukprot:XP_009532198.1 hypothetical protein PHYSODRAFT_250808 [Phytophthora sojae]